MRREYEMSEDQLTTLMDACKPVVCMNIGGFTPRSPQEKVNKVWAQLGKQMGFLPLTVEPIPGKSNKHFTAETANKTHEGQDVT